MEQVELDFFIHLAVLEMVEIETVISVRSGSSSKRFVVRHNHQVGFGQGEKGVFVEMGILEMTLFDINFE